MTRQEKKEYLQQYRTAEQEEERLSGEIARWRSRAEQMTVVYRRSTAGGGDGRSLEHTVERIDALIRQLVAQLDELVALRQEIGAAIDAVPDTRLRALLRLRYIDGLRFEQIAKAIGYYDLRWVYRLHNLALEALTIESHHRPVL